MQREIIELIGKDSRQFAESIKSPEKSVDLPYDYQIFLMMDILKLKREEIEKMSFNEYFKALDYCWLTYTLRRIDFTLAKMFSEKGSETSGEPVLWDTPVKEPQQQFSIIPEYIKKGVNKN